jgi:hypothetical protein
MRDTSSATSFFGNANPLNVHLDANIFYIHELGLHPEYYYNKNPLVLLVENIIHSITGSFNEIRLITNQQNVLFWCCLGFTIVIDHTDIPNNCWIIDGLYNSEYIGYKVAMIKRNGL